MEKNDKCMEGLKNVREALERRLDLIINAESSLHSQFNIDYKKIVANGMKVVVVNGVCK